MLLQLLFFLASLQIPAAASLNCERKHIGQPDPEIIQNVVGFGLGCGKGPGWAAIKPENKFKRHNFGPDTDTYELFWASLVRWPECVTQLQVGVNYDWQDLNQQNPITYEVDMPECKQYDNFKLELKIFFPGLLSTDQDKCIVVNLGPISHTMPGISDFLYSIVKTPETELSGVNVNIYWQRNKVKSSKCLDRVEATSNKNPLMKMTIKPDGGNPSFIFPRMCKAHVATVTYFFKVNLFPENVRTIYIPPLSSLCNNQGIIETGQNLTTTKLPSEPETDTDATQPQNNNFSTTVQPSKGILAEHRLPIIFGGSCFSCVALIAIIVLVVVIVRRRRKRREENDVPREDLNPVYGVYYSGEADYSTVTDNNALYEREGGEDGHNIVRDNNSNYGNTG